MSQNIKVDWIWDIEHGLQYGHLADSAEFSGFKSAGISVLKIDPAYYRFELHSSKETKEIQKPADEWAKTKKLVAVINAGMYQADGLTNTGFMKNYDFINNPSLNSQYNAVVAFNRKNDSVPEFQIIDLKCQNWNELKAQYHSFTQGIRMIDCNQKNVWSLQEKRWSIAAIATDKNGSVLFLHARYPYRVHDFIKLLLKSDLEVKNAMYLEGGPEASFYLNHLIKIEQIGSYETGFREDDDNDHFWAIPNVIGITKK